MQFQINNTKIGKEFPTYIIAEISCNHNQDYNKAVELIHAAKLAGANAVKFQTYTPETITMKSDKPYFKIDCGTLWDGKTLYELYSNTYTPWEWFAGLKKEANQLGMDLFSSPFDITAVDFLEELGVPCYKIASFEVCDHVLLKRVAQTGKPVIISSGVSDLVELAEAVKVLRENGCQSICILKCTSAYPAPIEKANLRTIANISDTFGVVSGLSDHTKGIEVPVAAVCLGARIIEKHFKGEHDSGSADDAFSLTPEEFKQMVDSVRKVEQSFGTVCYQKTGQEQKNQKFKRSLFVVKDIKLGEVLTRDNLRSIRPSDGLHTRYYEQLLGKKVTRNISSGTPLSWDLVDLNTISIIPAQKNDIDCQQIFYWRNDPVTRQMSHNTAEKEWDSFRDEYYNQYFKNIPLFAIQNGQKIGFVSFVKCRTNDDLNDSAYYIGINIAPEHRGKGLSVQVIQASLEYIKNNHSYITKLIAEIKSINKASIKIFTKTDFKFVKDYTNTIGELVQIYELKL